MRWYVSSCDDLHGDIELPPNEVIALGRSTETGITDKSVSKLHTLLKFQPAKEVVLCKQLGKHPVIINGEEVAKDMKVRIGLSSVIELIPGKYRYTIQAGRGGKRHLSDSSATTPVKKHQTRPPSKEPAGETVIPCVSRDTGTRDTSHDLSSNTRPGGRVSRELSKFLLAKLECSSSDDTSSSPWILTKDLIVRNSTSKGSSKIAAFDFDHTLVTTKSGRVFPKGPDDWDIMCPGRVHSKLKQLHEDGFKLLIISNQNGIEAKKTTVQQFQEKIDKVVSKLGVPVQVLASPRATATRKPAPGMWIAFEELYNDNVPVDYSNSFYVGDAAGRTAGWDLNHKKRKDFSSSDREFAHNVGLAFYTPENFFLGQAESTQWSWKSFYIPKYIEENLPLVQDSKKLESSKQEMVIMVGYPGSGKSTFCKRHLKSYERVNLDDLKNYNKCVALIENSLSAGKSVVIDNTCPDEASRKRYIEVAKKYTVPVRCFVMNTTIDHARHNNRFRRIAQSGIQVPGIAFNTFKSRFHAPSSSEGFSDVLHINFTPYFAEKHLEELYSMFLGS
ncbi:hypothetical protein ACHWQZ_G018498 [Mnemiopsis leidyi]